MPRLLAAIVLLSGVSGAFGADHPHVVIKGDKLRFTLYEADAKAGFYRGTRFDHAGVFGNVEFAGHTLFGPWKGAHDPANHDDIVGPCDEFGIENALGYDDAKRWFIVRNSWGARWGMDGYFTMPYSYLLDNNLSNDFIVCSVLFAYIMYLIKESNLSS